MRSEDSMGIQDNEEDVDLTEAPEKISDELESLAGALIDYGLDLLSEAGELAPTLAVENAEGEHILLSFDEEETEECLDEAHKMVKSAAEGTSRIKGLNGAPERYALAYDGAIREDDRGPYQPALIVEYGERGMTSGYSAYLLYKHAGEAQKFVWTEPAAAGEVELLV